MADALQIRDDEEDDGVVVEEDEGVYSQSRDEDVATAESESHVDRTAAADEGVSCVTLNEHEVALSNESSFARFERIMNTESRKVKVDLAHAANVRYGPSVNQRVDIFGLDTIPPDSPLWIYVHGGRWQLFDKNMSCHMVRPLLDSNIRPIIADVDLLPNVSLEVMVSQVKDLLVYCLNYALNNNVKSVWVCGHSSGAHLTATLLDYSWLRHLDINLLKLFKGVVLISGVYDLTTIVGTEKNRLLNLDNDRAIRLSPLHVSLSPVVTRGFSVLMAVGLSDDPYFIQETRKYYQFLCEAGARVHLLEEKNLDHFDINLNLISPHFSITKTVIKMINHPPAST